MLKLKLQYFGHLMWRTDSLDKILMLGKTEGRRRRGQQRMSWLDGITNSMDMRWEGQGSLTCCSPWCHKESDMTEQLNNNIYTSWFPKPNFASKAPFHIKMLLPLTLKYCLALWCHGNDWRQRTWLYTDAWIDTDWKQSCDLILRLYKGRNWKFQTHCP